jgi:hypothetical protein
MPRRNDIAKILIIGSGPNRLVALAMAFLFVVALHLPVQACSLSLARVRVSPDFRVIVSHGSIPIPGIQVEVYDEDERHQGDAAAERKPVLTLVTSQDGIAEIKNLNKGKYLVETMGPGGRSAVYAVIGDSTDKITSEISLQWPFSLHETLKTRSFSGELLSNDPWTPFQNVQVELWAPGLEKPLAKEDTGPQGRFHFDVTRPGIYVLRVIGRQDGVNPDRQIGGPDRQIGGEVAVELDPSAQDAMASLPLQFAMTTCGLTYSSCPGNGTPVATASRRIKVMHEPGVAEFPEVKDARYKLLDDRGASIAEGTADSHGIAELPSEFVGKATLVVASSGLTAIQQPLDMLTPDESAPSLVVTMTSIGGSKNCSATTLEKHAP